MTNNWSLCLQSRQGRKVVSLDANASTLELYESSAKEFGVAIERLKAGFPPKPIPSDQSTPISAFVSNQERIQVEFATSTKPSASPAKRKGATKKSAATDAPNKNSGSSTDTRRSKRAASKAATESMPALIKAQEDYLKTTAAASSGKKRARGGKSANGIHGIFPSPNNNNNKKRPNATKSVTLPASAGAGRRLADGATVANPRRAGRQAAKQRRLGGDGSTDMSTALMGAMHDKGQMGIILRKGMKNAVLSSYETTRSFSRLAAIQARSYQMTNLAGDTSTSGGGGGGGDRLQVTYHGTVDKTKVEETVECIPRDVLQAVMEGIHASNKESLRPENLSRLSPRVLWSCVHYFPTRRSIPDMYRELLPDLDWSFLRRRAEQLSEKALENKRQAMEDEEEGMDLERASNVVAAVEHAMEHLQDYHVEERKARQAQAAEARLRRLQAQDDTVEEWELKTPSEPDRDELRECIEASVPSTTTSGTTKSVQTTKWISQLMKDHKIHNWRELANVSDPKLANLVVQLKVPQANLRLWIDKAQGESVSEIMVEICDNNIQAVEILTECARSGTPKDLAGWRSIPDLLLEQLKQKYLPETKIQNPSQTLEWMDLGTISTWCDRAHSVLQDYEWLNWYATPV